MAFSAALDASLRAETSRLELRRLYAVNGRYQVVGFFDQGCQGFEHVRGRFVLKVVFLARLVGQNEMVRRFVLNVIIESQPSSVITLKILAFASSGLSAFTSPLAA